jgi:hypothetical protein
MHAVAEGRTATLLPDGRVLFAGGVITPQSGSTTALDEAEIYDPATGKFTPTGHMTEAREWHTATLLADGRVLMAGGWNMDTGMMAALRSAEIYDPAVGKFSPTGSMASAREKASASILSDGRVLIAGGENESPDRLLKSAELFDPATGTFSPTGSMAAIFPVSTATLLEDGRVLIAGKVMQLYLP